MKAYNKKNEALEVIERTDLIDVVIVIVDGKKNRLMLKFQPLFDEKGNQLVDFSSLPLEVKITGSGKTSFEKKKESKTAKLIAELNDNKTFNHITKTWE